jgi:uncharacterized BrkB/YihY/UPF0761 family membrane protein
MRRESSVAKAAQMTEQPTLSARGFERGRWLVVAALILLGLVLYFRFAPSSRPAAPPAVEAE